MIELYNENTGEYRHINKATITKEDIDGYYWDNRPLYISPVAHTVILLDEWENKIGNIIFSDNIDGPVVKIGEETWRVVSMDGRVFFTPETQEEHASDEWLSLLEG